MKPGTLISRGEDGLLRKLASRLTVLIALCAFTINCQGQTSPPPLDGYIRFDSTGVSAYFYVQVPDTINITSIEVGFGRDSTDYQFLHEYAFDVTSGLPSGLSYSRTGDKVYLGMGTQDRPNVFYGKARIKNSSGVWSDPFDFFSN